MAFRGQYEYTLDAKNRLTIPAKFRAALSDGVVLAKALDPCVAIWTPQGWEQFTERALSSRDPFSPDARKLKRYFHASSFDLQLDSAGRIMVPKQLLEYAGLGKEVVVVGNLDTIEAWDAARWRSYSQELDATAEQAAQRLSGSHDHPA
ncbi:MAG: division/cell wall cluster transcriptional repressor MraZ [Solirubrobacterales bacterium]